MQVQAIEGFRISPQQRHLWLQSREGARKAARCLVSVAGDVDPALLRHALGFVVDRHEIFRTTFHGAPGLELPVQVIEERSEPSLVCLDWSGLDPHQRQQRLEGLWRESEEVRFDLARGPMLRVTWVRIAPGEQLLLLAMPMFCADSWTLHNVVAEIAQACAGDGHGSEEPMQYADFSEWQNEIGAEEGAEEGCRYWQAAEVPLHPVESLSFGMATPGAGGFRPETMGWRMFGKPCLQIAELAERCDVSTAAVLLTCWQILLSRISGERDLVVAELCDGRKFGPLRGACGLFARTLPVRCRFTESFRFEEALRVTAETVEENRGWQEYFSWELIRAEQAEHCFPLVFEFDSLPTSVEAGGRTFTIRRLVSRAEPFALELRCFQAAHPGLGFLLSFDPLRVRPEEVRHLAGLLDTLIESALENPRETLAGLNLLSASDRHRATVELNDTAAPHPATSIHGLIEEQAVRMPDSVAVTYAGQELTYGGLDHRAAVLAHHLVRRGIVPGSVVGVLSKRSPELVIGLLGILKAGAAYVVLEPDQPKERLAYILRDTSAPLVLVQGDLWDAFPNIGVETFPLSSLTGSLNRAEQKPDGVPSDPEGLAYVVYTSGSTGHPKGVLASHRGVVNFLRDLTASYGLTSRDAVLQIAAPSFDASVRDMLGPLTVGARVVLARNEEAKDPGALVEKIARHGITGLLSVVPTMLRALAEAAAGTAADKSSLRIVLTSGEILTFPDCAKVRERIGPAASVVNQYGPTETTMTSTYYRVHDLDASRSALLIGRPISNVRVYVLDQDLAPVPLGAAGAIYIGGSGLAWGYLNRPELTAESFLPDPIGREPGARLYRTGDLARLLAGGYLEFLGRQDHQVKVRGIRVELGEIESVLREFTGLRQAVVAACEEPSGDLQLVVYGLVPAGGTAPALVEVQEFLRRRLLEPMIPSALVLLEALPLTRTGKVDRHALPAPERRAGPEGSFTAPRTPLEEVLAGIWSRILGIDRVSIHDNFFALGGHSLMATQVAARVQDAFQVRLPLQSVFDHPTVLSLAAAIERSMADGTTPSLPAIEPVSRRGPLPLSFAQQRHWFLHRLEPGSPLFNNVGAVSFEGTIDIAAVERSFAAILDRHEALRTRFPEINGDPVQVIEPAVSFRIPIVDLSSLPAEAAEQEAGQALLMDARRPFDLAGCPLLRMTFLRLAEDRHMVLLNMHHIISDAWSIGVLLRELGAMYGELACGRPATLPDLALQYADFASWQRRWIQGAYEESQLSYWRGQLAGAPPPLELPTDHLRATAGPPRSGRLSFDIDAALTSRLRQIGLEEGVTLYMTLLAAFQALLRHYTGQDDVVVGSPIANRVRPETESLIGCFINALALRVDLGGNPSFRSLLARVRKVVLGANAHQDLPFERVVEELKPDRSLARLPFYRVVFNFQNNLVPPLELPGLTGRLLEVETGMAAKYDVTVYLWESDDALRGFVRYNATLFEPRRISGLVEDFETILRVVTDDVEIPLEDLDKRIAESARQRDLGEQQDLKQLRRERLKTARRKAVNE